MQFVILTVIMYKFQLSKYLSWFNPSQQQYLHSNTLQIRAGLNYLKPGGIFESIDRGVNLLLKRRNIKFCVEGVKFHVLIQSFKSGKEHYLYPSVKDVI